MQLLKIFFGGRKAGLKKVLEDGAVIIDVRTPEEFRQGHVKGSRNIPLNKLREHVDRIRKFGKPVVLVCRSGSRSGMGRGILSAAGIEAVNGGAWTQVNKILQDEKMDHR